MANFSRNDNPIDPRDPFPPEEEQGTATSGPVIDEPPLAEDDTRPKVPVVWPMAAEPPIDPLADTAELRVPRAPARLLLTGVVMVSTVCMCLLMVSFAGFAGYRDGLATNDVKITQTLATGVAQQYATGVSDLQQGYAELAEARFAWIVETVQAPTQYALDSRVQLALARTIVAYTDTPTLAPTATPTLSPTPTETPSPVPTVPATATIDPLEDPDYLYSQADTAMQIARYEDAIEWLDALLALDSATLDPQLKAEATTLLMQAMTRQGTIYLRGQNTDGADMLARGVLLIYRAKDLGTIEPDTVLGEAIFAEMYINARNYVNGGYYDTAIPILEELCAINCGWEYHTLSVRSLLERAQAGASGQ